MNKIQSISVGVMVLVILVFSCKNSTFMSGEEYPHLVKLDSIRDQYNGKREQKDWTTILEGNVTMTVSAERVSINLIPKQGNEELITYFLQGVTTNYNLKSDSLGRSEVLFLGRNLVVHPFSQSTAMLLTVRDVKPGYLNGFTDMKQYTGYGLGARKFIRNGLHDNVPSCLCEKLGSARFSCSIGGDDAHGCANGTPDGSCEVSCSDSAYACCDIQK